MLLVTIYWVFLPLAPESHDEQGQDLLHRKICERLISESVVHQESQLRQLKVFAQENPLLSAEDLLLHFIRPVLLT